MDLLIGCHRTLHGMGTGAFLSSQSIIRIYGNSIVLSV